MRGYQHPDYAESLREFGIPRYLPGCQGWVLQRRIPDSEEHDAMGCYPLFRCQDWSKLAADLYSLEVVSVAMVPDPFDGYRLADLRRVFPDALIPFKEHFIIDTRQNPESTISKHHRYYSRRALRDLTIEITEEPLVYLDEWTELYAGLVERHRLQGIKKFSRAAFELQLQIPGVVMVRAKYGSSVVGSHLWFRDENVATSHLAAFAEEGYSRGASYALYWKAIEYFRSRVRWLNIGAGAGSIADQDDGLTRFKKGWATQTRTAYFCGRVLRPQKYKELVERTNQKDSNYFPAYRNGEHM